MGPLRFTPVWNDQGYGDRKGRGVCSSSARRTGHLFENEGAALYEDVVAEGGLRPDDPRIAPDGPDRPAFDLLVRIGLLISDLDGRQLHRRRPHDGPVPHRLAAEPRRRPAAAPSPPTGRPRSGRSPRPGGAPPVRHAGRSPSCAGDAIDSFIAAMVADAESELLDRPAADGPRTHPRSPRRAVRDVAAIERGHQDAHALPALGPPQLDHPQVRRRGHRRAAPRCARSTSSSTG